MNKGPRGVRVHMVPPILSDQISAQVSIEFNLRGPNYTIINACSTGNNAIGDAATKGVQIIDDAASNAGRQWRGEFDNAAEGLGQWMYEHGIY